MKPIEELKSIDVSLDGELTIVTFWRFGTADNHGIDTFRVLRQEPDGAFIAVSLLKILKIMK